jgi:aspartate racemase
LIGGIGPAATEFYYRGLIDRHAAAQTLLELTIVHADVHEMVRNLAARDPRAQAVAFERLVRRLAAAGARAAAVTSMGGHFCIRELEQLSSLPLVNALPAVRAEIRRRGLRQVGIIGTRMVMETRLYGCLEPVNVIVPEDEEFERVQAAYGTMATAGRVSEAEQQTFFAAGRRLMDRGAEAVLLGGTDLFLAFQSRTCDFPVIDLADIHVAEIHRRSQAPD